MFYALTGLLNAISSSVLGFFVYTKNPKKSINRTFGIFCFFTAFWSYFYFFWQISTSEKNALLWSRLLMAGAIFIPISYLHFVFSFTQETKKNIVKIVLFVGYLVSFFFFLSDFTPWFVANVKPILNFKFWPSAGPLYLPFLFLWFFGAVYSIILLFRDYKRSSGVKKSQLSYILLGTSYGYLGGITNYFLWYDIPIPPIGNWAITLYIFLVAFAIIKYHLFDVRVIATELFTFTIWGFLFVKLFLSGTSQELIINFSLFFAVIISGILLIRSVLKEVEQREKMEILTKKVRDAYEVEKKAHKELEKLDEAKTQFMMATQHHLRTPLTAMIGYLDLIFGGSYGKVYPNIKDVLLKFQISTKRLNKVVNELLDISQFQLGKKVVSFQPNIKVEPILKEIIEELQFEVKAKNLYLELQKPLKLPTIKADPEKLKVALTNIIDNAVKYTLEGGVIIKVEAKDSKILISVKDTGIGIPKGEDKNIFDRVFERGKKAKKVHVTGKGIGLYITAHIINAHNGKVWVESEGKGKGSTFYIELPAG